MRLEIIYYEPKRKEFRKKETFLKFMQGKTRAEILQVAELKGKTRKLKIMPEHIYQIKWEK